MPLARPHSFASPRPLARTKRNETISRLDSHLPTSDTHTCGSGTFEQGSRELRPQTWTDSLVLIHLVHQPEPLRSLTLTANFFSACHGQALIGLPTLQ
jgi:hypothetical protein